MNPVLLGKLGYAIAALCASVYLTRSTFVYSLSQRSFDRAALVLAAFLRLGLFTAIFVVLGESAKNDVVVYHLWINRAMEGQIPGSSPEHFPLVYGPFFYYILIPVLTLWNSPKAIILAMIALELLAIGLWLKGSRKATNERTVRAGTILYVLSPISIFSVAMMGNNNTILVLLLGLSFLLLLCKRDGASGLALGASIVCAKFLTMLQAPVLFVCAQRKVVWSLGFLLLPVIAYSLWYALGVDPISSLLFHAGYPSSGNLPYVLSLFELNAIDGPGRSVANIAGLAMLAIVFLTPLLRRQWYSPRDAMPLMVAIMFVTMMVSGKSFPHYLIITLFPLCVTLGAAPGRALPSMTKVVLFGILGVLCSVESTLWFRWLEQGPLSMLYHTDLRPDGLTDTKLYIFIAIELAMMTLYAYFIYVTMATVMKRPLPAPEPQAQPATTQPRPT